jgi:hypothetical protein
MRAQLRPRTSTIPSGHVYLGQFIDHDITRDIRKLAEADPDVEHTANHRTSRLDLDVLYGKDPSAVPCLYESDGCRLKLGSTLDLPGNGRPPMADLLEDLPRDVDGAAVVMDARSDENLLIAQLHVLFAKFHNTVLKLLDEQHDLWPGPEGGTLFQQARRFVTWHYQWIVVNEFLPLICRQAVLADVAQKRFVFFQRPYTQEDGPVAIPVEFSVAAYRFGHSMIQTKYFLNDSIGLRPTDDIITMTRRGEGINATAPRLPAAYLIGWRDHFFAGLPGQINLAQHIDTFISEVLYELPPLAVNAFRVQLPILFQIDRARMPHPLPEITLRRGSKIKLPSGQEFAEYFNLPVTIAAENMHAQPEDRDFFRTTGFDHRTPLWYYLLREAAVEPNPEPTRGPDFPLQKLGSIGSRIVAEVFYQLLNTDADSIVHAGKDWTPPVFSYGSGGRRWSLRSMARLADFVANVM